MRTDTKSPRGRFEPLAGKLLTAYTYYTARIQQ